MRSPFDRQQEKAILREMDGMLDTMVGRTGRRAFKGYLITVVIGAGLTGGLGVWLVVTLIQYLRAHM